MLLLVVVDRFTKDQLRGSSGSGRVVGALADGNLPHHRLPISEYPPCAGVVEKSHEGKSISFEVLQDRIVWIRRHSVFSSRKG